MSHLDQIARIVLAGVAMFATSCGAPTAGAPGVSGASGVQAPLMSNHVESTSSASGLVGAYACTIAEGEYSYPAFPCVIADGRHGLELIKLGGSQRFRGHITPFAGRAGFSFSGTFFCPWGDCTQPLAGDFVAVGGGTLRGTFPNKPEIVVTIAHGGAQFGGAAYGGAMYGGAAYGGATYGVLPGP